MDFPSDLKYTDQHEWLRLSDDGTTVTVGITEFAQQELGDIVFVELEEEGSEFDKDDVFGTVEAVKTVSELYMPVSGTISALNEELDANPQYVNEDPYGKGWMVQVTLSDPSELDELMDADEYAAQVG